MLYEYENFILIRHMHNTNISSNELFTEYNRTTATGTRRGVNMNIT
jgi:hypothetical protein